MFFQRNPIVLIWVRIYCCNVYFFYFLLWRFSNTQKSRANRLTNSHILITTSTLNIILALAVNTFLMPLAQFWIVLKHISDIFSPAYLSILHHNTSVYTAIPRQLQGDWMQDEEPTDRRLTVFSKW